MLFRSFSFSSFFFNDTATTEIYTLSLHDALPISFYKAAEVTLSLSDYNRGMLFSLAKRMEHRAELIADSIPVYDSEYEEQETHIMASKIASILVKDAVDRKSTRLNSSHTDISRMPSSA